MNNYEKDARERIKAVDEQDHEQYAYMIMKSLRGWGHPRPRVDILQELCERGQIYDAETREQILAKAKQFKQPGMTDGRTFRVVYEDIDVALSPGKARRLSKQIPNDKMWDEWRFEQMKSGKSYEV